MEQAGEIRTGETRTSDTSVAARAAAISAGDVSVAVRAELTRLLAANGGERRKALPAGFDELVRRNAVRRTEAKELAALVDQLFDASDGALAFGGVGAVVGAGIDAGFGGPIGAGVGAVVGAAVGVCIEDS